MIIALAISTFCMLVTVIVVCSYSITIQPSISIYNIPRYVNKLGTALSMAGGSSGAAFNPFTSRSRNTKVKWYENDMGTFYAFVENQPLLTSKQELQYGKAIKMWFQVEQMRDELEKMLQLNATASSGIATNVNEGITTTTTAPAATAATAQTITTSEDNVRYDEKEDDDHDHDNDAYGIKSTHVYVTDEDLAKKIGCTVLTLEKMKRYAELSKRRLVNSNLKLVMAVVSRYRQSNIPNSELIAEGTRGLAKAALRYDYSKGFRFATYATWYIHQSVSDYVRFRKHPARMPSRYIVLTRRVKAFTSAYQETHHRMPTVPEMSKSLSVSEFDIIKSLSMQAYPILLHSPLKTRDSHRQTGVDKTYEDVLPSLFKTPTDLSSSKDLRRDMESMIQTNLNEVERDVLRLRLGLDDGQVKPVKEIGRKFHISWKQVRSLEKQALSKLLDSNEIGAFCNKMMDV